jgi:hypothetical protein
MEVIKYQKFGNRLRYEGSTKNGLPSGKGKLFYKSGDKYKGFFVDGLEHGFGEFIFSADSEYDESRCQFISSTGFMSLFVKKVFCTDFL